MSVLEARVRVGVEVTGSGDAPKKVDDTARSIDKMRESSGRATTSVLGLKERVGALKEGVGPINILREGFEHLRANAALVGAAIAAIVTVAGALWEVLDTPRLDSTTERFFNLAGAVSESTSALAAMVNEASKMAGALASVDAQIADIDAAVAEREGRWADALRLREEGAKQRLGDQIESTAKELGAADDIANRAEDAVRKARKAKQDVDIERGHLELLIKMRREQGLGTTLQEQQLGGVLTAQAAVVANLELAESAYDKAARSVDGYSRKLVALERYLDSLDKAPAPRPEPPRRLVGGGGTTPIPTSSLSPAEIESLLSGPTNGDELLALRDKQRKELFGVGGVAANDNSEISNFASDIRDFTAAMSDALPGMAEFSGALTQISELWGKYAETGEGAARATIMSVGAIALAGAEQIKNERLKAGVLATIHLGLGTALMFVPGSQQEALGHLAGAAILGGVAIFGSGSGSGSGSRSASAPRSMSRPLQDPRATGGWTVNVFGGWFGTASPQETAAALYQLTRRGGGSGFVPTQWAA